jgi:RNA polymerase sigma-70 factor, ECF subfamily
MSKQDEELTAFYKTCAREVFVRIWAEYGARSEMRDEIEDVVQDAFLDIWKRWGHLSKMSQSDLRKYVIRAALNDMHDRYRKLALSRRTMAGLRAGHTGAIFHVEEAAEASEAVRAMHELPERQRAVAIRNLVEGIPQAQIGPMLGIEPGTVRAHLHRAKQALRRRLGDQDRGPGGLAGPDAR